MDGAGMKKIFSTFLYLTVFISLFTSESFAQSFEDFVNEREKDSKIFTQNYNSYRSKMDQEFDEYKKIVDEEFKNYAKKLSQHWGHPVLSSNKKWVEYSKDLKKRKSVDFEKGEIEVSIIVADNDQNYEKKLDDLLSELLTENTRTAFSNDPISVNIEKRIKKKLSNVVTALVEKKPIVTDIFFSTPKPSKNQVKNRVSQIKKHTKIKKKPAKNKNETVYTVNLRIPKAFQRKAKAFIPLVKKNAARWKVDPALIMAIIQTESAFNPMAKSYVPAYGLMQIVPRSAGLDASRVIFGKRKKLSPTFLYSPSNNINVGSCYVNILLYKYLSKIKNSSNRLLCAIASYNTGSGNVARAFIGTMNINKAADKINRMSKNQVYTRLINHLKHKEAVSYVKNITKRMDYYKGIK